MKDTHKKIKKAWILLHNDIFIFYHFLNRIFIENCSSSCCKMCSKMRNTCNVCKISLQWSINTFSSLQNNSMLLFPETRRVLIRAVLRVPRGLFQQRAAPNANRTRPNAGCAMAIGSVRTELLKPKGSFTQPRSEHGIPPSTVSTWRPPLLFPGAHTRASSPPPPLLSQPPVPLEHYQHCSQLTWSSK